MQKKEFAKVRKLSDVVTRIGVVTGHPDISLHSIKVLFTVALADLQGEPVDSREIAKKVGISTSGVSRAIALLGEWHRGKPGLGLVTAVPELSDRRRKPVTLTLRGRKAIEALAGEL